MKSTSILFALALAFAGDALAQAPDGPPPGGGPGPRGPRRDNQQPGGKPEAGQPPRDGQGGPGGPGGNRPVPPIIAALDADHDGIISAAEIANASVALKALDKNGDGQLTMDEIRPAPPQGGGPDGGGRGPNPGGPDGGKRPPNGGGRN